MITLNPYVNFAGRTREAMEFYAAVLGAELEIQTIGESPVKDHMPAEMADQIMHSTLRRDGNILLMASDMMAADAVETGSNVNFNLNFTAEDELRSIYDKLAEGGEATTPPRKEFWGGIYSELNDKFGLRWMLNFQAPNHDES